MLTRKQVAERIGRSISTVRRMEGEKLTPSVDSNGVHWFDEVEVEEVREEILRIGRALSGGAAQDAINLARAEKKQLIDDLEFAQITIARLCQQNADLQHRLAMGRFESGAKPGPYATIYRTLQEDVDYLIRRIPTPSFQTEMVITRVITALKGL